MSGEAQQILDAVPGIVYVYDLVEQRNVYANLRWYQDFGYGEGEMAAAGARFLASILHPEDLPRVGEHHRALAESPDDRVRSVEYRIRRKSGDWIWLSSRDRPFVRDDAGRVLRIVGSAHDITPQKLAEAARSESEARFHAEAELRQHVIEAGADGICVCEDIPEPPGIHFSVWSPRMTEISGYTREEINRLGWHQTVYTDEETRARAADRMQRMRRGEDLVAEEWVITRKDGARRTLLISTQVLGGHGTPKVLGVMRDVTDQRALEGRVRQAERLEAVGRLAGAVAHDFNNLLTAILGGAELLAMTANLSEHDRALTHEIVLAAQRGSELTRQLLTFSRKRRAEMHAFDLSERILQMRPVLERLLGERYLLETRLAGGAFVLGDATLLEQVVLNLVVNARDAMPAGGTVLVGVEVDGGVRLRVRDTGSGIPAHVLPHVFEPFFTTKPEGKGTGLGLATVYGIVSQHGGRVSIDSEVGVGTELLVVLPRATAVETPSTSSGGTPAVKKLSVLVVEDRAPVRQVVRRMFEALGHEVFEADTPETARRVFEEHGQHIGLLFSDVSLGQHSGLELAQELALLRPGLEVAYMTGNATELSSLHLDVGRDFLQKPFSAGELAALLDVRFGARAG